MKKKNSPEMLKAIEEVTDHLLQMDDSEFNELFDNASSEVYGDALLNGGFLDVSPEDEKNFLASFGKAYLEEEKSIYEQFNLPLIQKAKLLEVQKVILSDFQRVALPEFKNFKLPDLQIEIPKFQQLELPDTIFSQAYSVDIQNFQVPDLDISFNWSDLSVTSLKLDKTIMPLDDYHVNFQTRSRWSKLGSTIESFLSSLAKEEKNYKEIHYSLRGNVELQINSSIDVNTKINLKNDAIDFQQVNEYSENKEFSMNFNKLIAVSEDEVNINVFGVQKLNEAA